MLRRLGREPGVEGDEDVVLRPARLGSGQVLLVVALGRAVAERRRARAQRIGRRRQEHLGGREVEAGVAGLRRAGERAGQAVEAAVQHAELGGDKARDVRVVVTVRGERDDVEALGDDLGEPEIVAAEVHDQRVDALRRPVGPAGDDRVQLVDLRRVDRRLELVGSDPALAHLLRAVVATKDPALVGERVAAELGGLDERRARAGDRRPVELHVRELVLQRLTGDGARRRVAAAVAARRVLVGPGIGRGAAEARVPILEVVVLDVAVVVVGAVGIRRALAGGVASRRS